MLKNPTVAEYVKVFDTECLDTYGLSERDRMDLRAHVITGVSFFSGGCSLWMKEAGSARFCLEERNTHPYMFRKATSSSLTLYGLGLACLYAKHRYEHFAAISYLQDLWRCAVRLHEKRFALMLAAANPKSDKSEP